MDDLNEENEEANDEIKPLRRKDSRRQRQQLRFAEEEDDDDDDEEKKQQQKSPSSFKPPGRASRFLSICDPSLQLPGANLLRLRQLHRHATNDSDSVTSEDISDELLDKIPFKIEIIPDRRDDFNLEESSLTKSRRKTKEPMEIPTVIPSELSQERRLEIIEEILKDLSQKNVFDEIRRANAIPFQLPRNTQMQKNVADRIRDLTGSEIIMLNDPIYMKNLCKHLDEKHKKELQANFDRFESNEKRRHLFELRDQR